MFKKHPNWNLLDERNKKHVIASWLRSTMSSSSCSEDMVQQGPQSECEGIDASVCVNIAESMAHVHLGSSEVTARKHRGNSTKQLHFAPVEAQIVEYLPMRAELTTEEVKAVWWDADDYEEFKLTAKLICKEVRQNSKYTAGLDSAYRRATRAAVVVNERPEEATDIESALEHISLDMGLAQWCAHGHSRRGLERWGSRIHGINRSELAHDVKSSVCKLSSKTDSKAQLRFDAEKRSRVARIFARMMGEADAVAAIPLNNAGTFINSRWTPSGHNPEPLSTRNEETKSSDAPEPRRMAISDYPLFTQDRKNGRGRLDKKMVALKLLSNII